jgi:hypothetical protein
MTRIDVIEPERRGALTAASQARARTNNPPTNRRARVQPRVCPSQRQR